MQISKVMEVAPVIIHVHFGLPLTPVHFGVPGTPTYSMDIPIWLMLKTDGKPHHDKEILTKHHAS